MWITHFNILDQAGPTNAPLSHQGVVQGLHQSERESWLIHISNSWILMQSESGPTSPSKQLRTGKVDWSKSPIPDCMEMKVELAPNTIHPPLMDEHLFPIIITISHSSILYNITSTCRLHQDRSRSGNHLMYCSHSQQFMECTVGRTRRLTFDSLLSGTVMMKFHVRFNWQAQAGRRSTKSTLNFDTISRIGKLTVKRSIKTFKKH